MENVTQHLLANYYGFGGGEEKFLASHEGFHRELCEQKSEATDLDGNLHHEDTVGAGQSSEVLADNPDEGNGVGDGIVRSWRATSDDYDAVDETTNVASDEAELEVKSVRKNTAEDVKTAGTKLLEKVEGKEEAGELGVAEEGVPDSASDVSGPSTKTRKKSIRKKSKFSTGGLGDPQPLVLLPPRPRKNPIYNKEFCDLTSAGIIEFPVNLLEEISTIRMLYLDNNCLNELPDELFTSLTFLQWLDARNNWLKAIPSAVKHHQYLETMLLQGNRLEALPLELCLVPKLKTLQVAGNPLLFPPIAVAEQGFAAIMSFLRNEWNTEYPNETVTPPPEIRSASTVLCDDPPLLSSTRSSRKFNTPSMSDLSKSLKSLSTREKSRNYRPSNRCRSSGSSSALEEKLRWIDKVREMLGRQATALQRAKDQEALREWRRDRRSFDKSMKKAASRTPADIPFDTNYTTPFFSVQPLQKSASRSRRNNIGYTADIDKKMFEIVESLKTYQSNRKSKHSSTEVQLRTLQSEIEKIENLYEEIQALKRQNATSCKKYSGPSVIAESEPYKPPPSIIV